MNKGIISALLLGTALVTFGCGSTTSTGTSSSSSGGSSTAGGTDAGTGTATSSVFSTQMASNGTGAANSESVAKAVAKALKTAAVGKTETTGEINEPIPAKSCTTSGSVSGSITGTSTVTSEGQTLTGITLDCTMTMNFEDCVESAAVPTSSGSTCTLTATLDGTLPCDLTGSFTTSTLDFDMTCATTSACEGFTVTVGGTAHTIGFNFSASMAGNVSSVDGDDVTMTGSLCIDGDTFTFADLEAQADDFTAEQLGCQ
ncbi:MAG: hypothetical protein HY696_08110 [Deltaproteobacteria bacterium]|nr:hypothetical protein [Deltaproteobacteria bacterium]